jgi:L-fuculose-phosphate aldolase
LERGDVVLMGNHGLVAVGRSLEEAFSNALSVEYTTMVNIYVKVLGRPVELSMEEVRAVKAIHNRKIWTEIGLPSLNILSSLKSYRS